MSIKRLAFEEEVVPIRITTTFFSIFLMLFILLDVQSIEFTEQAIILR
jgi:hypothetical protein